MWDKSIYNNAYFMVQILKLGFDKQKDLKKKKKH